MLKKVKNTFFILSFLIFIIFIINFYFSDKNIIKTNKSRSNYIVNLNEGILEIRLFNVMGDLIFREILSNTAGEYNKILDMGGFNRGVYFLQMSSTRQIINTKIIIE